MRDQVSGIRDQGSVPYYQLFTLPLGRGVDGSVLGWLA
jgi:hypothetical protein